MDTCRRWGEHDAAKKRLARDWCLHHSDAGLGRVRRASWPHSLMKLMRPAIHTLANATTPMPSPPTPVPKSSRSPPRTKTMTDIGQFIRGHKRYQPPFRIVYSRRRGGAPLLVKDARAASPSVPSPDGPMRSRASRDCTGRPAWCHHTRPWPGAGSKTTSGTRSASTRTPKPLSPTSRSSCACILARNSEKRSPPQRGLACLARIG